MIRRPRVLAVLAALTATALVPSGALGAAGGGTGGFGGGGGGGGGGGFGGGGGGGYGGGYGGSYDLGPRGTAIAFGLIIAFFLIVWIVGMCAARAARRAATWSQAHAKDRDKKTRRARAARKHSIAVASASAAGDDPYFDQAAVAAAADGLFRRVQAAWQERDVDLLRTMIAPDLMVEWTRRLDDFTRRGWVNRLEIHSLSTEYVGLVNRDDDSDDRVVVRVAAWMDDYVLDSFGRVIPHNDNPSQESWLREYWTLQPKLDGDWRLISIEQDIEGEHNLYSPLIALPDEDVAGIRDEAAVEHAQANATAPGTNLGELIDVDFDDDALMQARDLALVDGRVDPDVIAVSVRRLVTAWAEAIDGDDDAMLALAPRMVVDEMLRPDGPKSRLVVRGPQVIEVRVRRVVPRDPVAVVVDVAMEGVRYVEDRDTVVVLSGDSRRRVKFVERFVLRLSGDDPTVPWRLDRSQVLARSAGR